MRIVQYKILTEILDNVDIPEYIFAFEKEKSIPVMAQRHVQRRLVISLDIKDFFPSITQSMVKALFERLSIAELPAKILSELCTYSFFLPQGALTSPKISNILAAGTFGPKVKKFCDDNELAMSIYADDITVSTNRPFDTVEAQTAFLQQVIGTITGFVEEYGFRINRKKTKVMKPFMRQYVCGTVVNQKVNLKKTDRLRLRAIVHNCSKNGIMNEATKTDQAPDKFAAKIMGQLNWFAQLNPTAGNPLKETFKSLIQEAKFDVAETAFTKHVDVVEIKKLEPLTA